MFLMKLGAILETSHSPQSILSHVSFVRSVHTPTALVSTSLTGSTLKITQSLWEIRRNHSSSYSLLIFTVEPTSSNALEVGEKCLLAFCMQWVGPYLALRAFLKEYAVKLIYVHHINVSLQGNGWRMDRSNLKQWRHANNVNKTKLIFQILLK